MREPETGLTVPVIDVEHPVEWNAFADAVIERGRLESRAGMYSTWLYHWREFPREYVEELAYAEDRVLTTQKALRRAMGVPEHLV